MAWAGVLGMTLAVPGADGVFGVTVPALHGLLVFGGDCGCSPWLAGVFGVTVAALHALLGFWGDCGCPRSWDGAFKELGVFWRHV